jgi:hypothetical protein
MSKLSSGLKALISAPFARPNTLPASPRIRSVYERLRQEASSKHVGRDSWLTLSVILNPSFPQTLADAIGTDSSDHDDELTRVIDGIIQSSDGIQRQDPGCPNSRVDEGSWIEVYRIQRRMSSPYPAPLSIIITVVTCQVPRTINCLGAFRASLPSEVVSSLSTKPTRYFKIL